MTLRLSSPTFGAPVAVLRLAGLTLTEASLGPRTHFPAHAHGNDSMSLVIGGSLTERWEGRPFAMRRDEVAFKPADAIHENVVGATGARILVIELSREWMRQHATLTAGCASAPSIIPSPSISRRLRREFRQPDSFTDIAVQSLCLELIHALADRQSGTVPRGRPVWLSLVVQALHDRFREPMTLSDLANVAGVHPVHLAQSFRRHQGTTVGSYLRQLRIDYGATQLRTTQRPLSEIALECGFFDQSHFSRYFKRYTGYTPAAFRDMPTDAAQASVER